MILGPLPKFKRGSSSASFSNLPGSVHPLPANQDSLMSQMLACPGALHGDLLADKLVCIFTWRVSCTVLVVLP